MKVKIYDKEVEMSEKELAIRFERTLEDASEMQFFIHFLCKYVYTARISGESCRAALITKLHDCLRRYCHYLEPLSKTRLDLEKEMHTFEGEAMRHHELMKQQYGPIAQVIK